jgi:hypothetical protein
MTTNSCRYTVHIFRLCLFRFACSDQNIQITFDGDRLNIISVAGSRLFKPPVRFRSESERWSRRGRPIAAGSVAELGDDKTEANDHDGLYTPPGWGSRRFVGTAHPVCTNFYAHLDRESGQAKMSNTGVTSKSGACGRWNFLSGSLWAIWDEETVWHSYPDLSMLVKRNLLENCC